MAIIDLDVAGFLGDARHHPHQVADGAHLLDLLHLLEEVLERERALHETGGSSLGLFLLEDFFGLLDEGLNIAHAEDAAGETIGVERVEVVEFLTGRGEGDWLADDLLD